MRPFLHIPKRWSLSPGIGPITASWLKPRHVTHHHCDCISKLCISTLRRQHLLLPKKHNIYCALLAGMSFGWSAGDIATGIAIIYNLIEALDGCDGAARDYREAVTFLQGLKRTLDPLQTFTAWNTHPKYGEEIKEQVTRVKEPICAFLDSVVKFEPSLGAKAARGHHRHILRKVQWFLFMTKRTVALRKKIESNLRIIDSLMQRLTL